MDESMVPLSLLPDRLLVVKEEMLPENWDLSRSGQGHNLPSLSLSVPPSKSFWIDIQIGE